MLEEIKELSSNIKEVVEKQEKNDKFIKDLAEAVDALKKRNGKLGGSGSYEMKTTVDELNEKFAEHFEEIRNVNQKGFRFEMKAGNITVGNISTTGSSTNIPYSYYSQIVQRPHRKITIRDLVPIINSTTGTFVYYAQPVGVLGSGSFGFQAGQGNVKALLDKNLIQNIVTCDYLAGTARVAKQVLQDLPSIQSFLAADLLESYRQSESAAFIPTLVAGANHGFTPPATVTAEKIIQVSADLMSRDYSPSAIVTDASTWAKLMNTKPNNYSLPGGSAISIDPAGNVVFMGMQVLVQNNMVPGDIIIGDFTKAAIIQAEGLSVGFFDQDQDNVVRNLITIRIESRVAFTVLRSDAFDYFVAGAT